jgi:hypothetical protein
MKASPGNESSIFLYRLKSVVSNIRPKHRFVAAVLEHRWIAAIAITALLSLVVHIWVPLRGIDTSHYFWLDHPEGLSTTTFGKWTHGASFGDGMSGEFPILYQYASDWLNNRLSDLMGVPPFQTQFFYGAVLPGILLISNFFFFNRLIASGAAAFLAAVMTAYMSDPVFVDPLYAYSGQWDPALTKAIYHVPATAIPLGTPQAVAYVLFVPALVSVYVGMIRASFAFAAIGGLVLGLLVQLSFLTFIGAVSAIGTGLSVAALVNDYRGGAPTIFLTRLALLAVGIGTIVIAARGSVTFLHLVLLWCILFGASLRELKNITFLFVIFVVALATALPLLVHLGSHWSSLARLAGKVNSDAPFLTTLIFFLPAWIATALLPFSPTIQKKQDEIAYLLGATLAILLLSKGELWGFVNHQYRFAITLLFPLSILCAIVLTSVQQRALTYLAAALLAWIAISTGRNMAAISGLTTPSIYNPRLYYGSRFGQFFYYVRVAPAEPVSDAFLRALGPLTADEKQSGSRRILLSPDEWVPNSLALGVSNLPAFNPDYRFIMDIGSFSDRLRIFCFLFPDYPYHLKDGLLTVSYVARVVLPPECNTDGSRLMDEGHLVAEINEPVLKMNILRLFDIRILADFNTPFGMVLKQHARAYRLEPVFSLDQAVIMKLPSLDTFPRLKNDGWHGDTWNIQVEIANPGSYAIVIAGKQLGHRFTKISVPNAATEKGHLYSDLFIGSAALKAGQNTLQLTACAEEFGRARFPEPTPIHFLAIVPANGLEKYIAISSSALSDTTIRCRSAVATSQNPQDSQR